MFGENFFLRVALGVARACTSAAAHDDAADAQGEHSFVGWHVTRALPYKTDAQGEVIYTSGSGSVVTACTCDRADVGCQVHGCGRQERLELELELD